MDKTMTLIKLLNNTSLLTPYEQSFIHSLDKEGELISEQNTGESNPILQLAIDPSNPPRDQSSRKTASTQCTRPATQRPKTPASTWFYVLFYSIKKIPHSLTHIITYILHITHTHIPPVTILNLH